jgi:starch-binding outer membrane protein SusE/F
MKFINICKASLFITLVLFIGGCKKDEIKTFAAAPISVANFVSSVTYSQTLALATKSNNATTFTWDKAMYGNDVAANYTLQYDSAGKGFVNPKEIPIGTALFYSMSQEQLNGCGISSGIPVGQNGSLEFRIKATVGSNAVLPSYSSVVTLNFSTYDAIVFWYLPGDYQGWKPSAAPKLGSVDLDNYVGYVYAVPTGYPKFKITANPDWSVAYGDGGVGKISSSGGDIAWPSPMPTTGSVYYITVQKSTLTYTITPCKFTIAGDFNGWSSSANELTYNLSNIYTFTTNFTAGGFKIVINGNTWCGGNGTGTLLIGSGDNFPVTAGTHTVSVDMSFPTRYKVTVQ